MQTIQTFLYLVKVTAVVFKHLVARHIVCPLAKRFEVITYLVDHLAKTCHKVLHSLVLADNSLELHESLRQLVHRSSGVLYSGLVCSKVVITDSLLHSVYLLNQIANTVNDDRLNTIHLILYGREIDLVATCLGYGIPKVPYHIEFLHTAFGESTACRLLAVHHRKELLVCRPNLVDVFKH